jgi:3-hydroxyanthranilate 3,4-dioxygenase
MIAPFNLQKWIDENRDILKPPVGNKNLYKEAGDFIVMVVGGPNSRKDYHYNESEELFYQLEGDITVRIQEDGQAKDIHVKQGEMFLLPPNVPHGPRRGAGTLGLVIERYRNPTEEDGFQWYCENCSSLLYDVRIPVSDIVGQLPVLMENFFSNPELCMCKNCGTLMQKPV